MRSGGSVIIGAVLSLSASGAWAHGPLHDPGTYFPAGFDLATTFGDGYHFVGGLEASIVEVGLGLTWVGLVSSLRYDGRRDLGAFSLAGEAGVGPLGVELGYTVHSDWAHGVRARLVLPAVVMTPYVGLDGAGGVHGEVGVLLKWPFGMVRW